MMQPAAATAAIMLSSFPSQNRFVTVHSGEAHAAVDFGESLKSFEVINSLDLKLRQREACVRGRSIKCVRA
jgi:hypothetical protein